MNANDKIKADLQRAVDEATEKADNLLVVSDSLGYASAAGKRLGRECQRWRRRAKELRDRIKEIDLAELKALEELK